MKEKKNITKDEIRSYMKELEIDEEKLFSLNRLTKDGQSQLQELFGYFTESRFNSNGSLEMLVEREDGKAEYFELSGSRVIDFNEMNSLEIFFRDANDLIDAHNKAINQAYRAGEILGELSDEQKTAFHMVWQFADQAVEQLNDIAKNREISFSDFNHKMIKVIRKQNEIAKDLFNRTKRAQELEELRNKNEQNNQEKER